MYSPVEWYFGSRSCPRATERFSFVSSLIDSSPPLSPPRPFPSVGFLRSEWREEDTPPLSPPSISVSDEFESDNDDSLIARNHNGAGGDGGTTRGNNGRGKALGAKRRSLIVGGEEGHGGSLDPSLANGVMKRPESTRIIYRATLPPASRDDT